LGELQKPQKKQILVISKDAVRYFGVLKGTICDGLKAQLLIHAKREQATEELSLSEIRGTDAVIITHDEGEGAQGSKELLRVVNTLQIIKLSLIILVLGVSGKRLQKRLQERKAIVSEEGLGKVTEEGLTRNLQQALGIEDHAAEDAPR